MAANPVNVINTLSGVQYDGTNRSDIAALEPGFDFNNSSELGGVWSFQSPPDSTLFNVNTGDWIMFAQNQVFSKVSNNEFLAQYSCNMLCSDAEAFSVGTQVRSIGVAPAPTLAASETADVHVALDPPMPDTSFAAYASKFAGVSLAELDITGITIFDEATVRVSLENSGVTSIGGATIMVHVVA